MKKEKTIYSTDLTKALDPYSDKWVALSSDEKRIVGTGITAKQAFDQARENKEDDPILTRVPKNYGSYIL